LFIFIYHSLYQVFN